MSTATHFEIDRSLDGATNWTMVARIPYPATTYNFNNYSSGDVTKYFRIRAVIDGVTQTALPMNSTYATSNAVTCSYGGAETSFKVERRRQDLGTWDEIASLAPGTITYDNAVSRFDYSYRVRGFNSYGYSAYSNLAISVPHSYSWEISNDLSATLDYSWEIFNNESRALDYSWNIKNIAGYRYKFGLDKRKVLY